MNNPRASAASDLHYFSWYFRNFFSFKARGMFFMLFWFSYLVPRAAFGTEGKNVVKKIFRGGAKSKERSMPFPLDGRTYSMTLADLQDFDVFHEICVRDFYGTASLIKPGMTVIDVGANIGTFAVVAGARAGERGKVISFEPETRNFSLAERSVQKNGFANVVMNRAAISNYTGMGKLHLSANYEGHSLEEGGIGFKDHSALGEESVVVTTIDDALAKLGIDAVDVLKIDVEGSEIKALEGARKTIERSPRIKIMADVIHYPGEEKEVADYLNAMGFKTVFIEDFIFAERA